MRKILIDFSMVAISSTLLLYLALQSVAGAKYAGAGFQTGNQNLTESIILVVIFTLGLSRLVIDLRDR